MLTIDDCIALSRLSDDEVRVIARHEHIPDIAATELGAWLVETPNGEQRISGMIRDRIHTAEATGHLTEAVRLKLVLRAFLHGHPDAAGRLAADPDPDLVLPVVEGPDGSSMSASSAVEATL